MESESFFDLDGEIYLGRDGVRGPWHPEHCHAGPVAGAIARSVERRIGTGRNLTRLTIDLIRPVPVAGFEVTVEITRESRRLATAHAVLTGLDGKVAATATAMAILPAPAQDLPNVAMAPHSMEGTVPGHIGSQRPPHGLRYIRDVIEIRRAEGENGGTGPGSLWMHTPPLVAGEEPTSFQRICPLADFGNAISRNGEFGEYTFLNPDLTIVAHRQSSADWLMSAAISHWHPNGIGLAEAHISDENGPVATALQSLIVGKA